MSWFWVSMSTPNLGDLPMQLWMWCLGVQTRESGGAEWSESPILFTPERYSQSRDTVPLELPTGLWSSYYQTATESDADWVGRCLRAKFSSFHLRIIWVLLKESELLDHLSELLVLVHQGVCIACWNSVTTELLKFRGTDHTTNTYWIFF